MEKSSRSWSGERGVINPQMLTKYLQGVTSPALRHGTADHGQSHAYTMLLDMGVDYDNIRIEEFAGY